MRSDALACSVCLPGDPNFSNSGTTSQGPGDWSFFAEYRNWKKISGELPHGEEGEDPHDEDDEVPEFEKNTSERLDLYLSWTPIERVTLTVNVPFAFNDITEFEGDEKTRIHADGLGDVSLMISGVLWRNRILVPSRWVEGRAFLKFPTGKSHTTVKGTQDPHIQRGTGSWDFGFGLAGTQKWVWGSAYGSVFYRENSKGSLSYRYGDVFLANAAIELPVGHLVKNPDLDVLVPGLELNFRYAEKDVFHGERFDDSGGSILYATPSLRVRLPWLRYPKSPSLRLAVQIPISNEWLHGFQEEHEIWSAGLLIPF